MLARGFPVRGVFLIEAFFNMTVFYTPEFYHYCSGVDNIAHMFR